MCFLRALWIAVLLLLETGRIAQAAFCVPPELENATEEQKALFLQLRGDQSLREKLEVGKQRYEGRLALHRALADTMRSNRERRQAVIGRQSTGAPAVRLERSAPHDGLYWLAALALVGACVFLHVRIRQARN